MTDNQQIAAGIICAVLFFLCTLNLIYARGARRVTSRVIEFEEAIREDYDNGYQFGTEQRRYYKSQNMTNFQSEAFSDWRQGIRAVVWRMGYDDAINDRPKQNLYKEPREVWYL